MAGIAFFWDIDTNAHDDSNGDKLYQVTQKLIGWAST